MEAANRHSVLPPGAVFDPQWYVSRDREEKYAHTMFTHGMPILLLGPPKIGKSWLLERLLYAFGQDTNDEYKIARIDLRRFQATHTYDGFLHTICTSISDSVSIPLEVLSAAWQNPYTDSPNRKANDFMEEYALLTKDRYFVLAIENIDAIGGYLYGSEFLSLLRVWAERGDSLPWSKLRLLTSVSTFSRVLSTTLVSPFFNISPAIRVGDFQQHQVKQQVEMAGLRSSEEAVTRLIQWVGGHPYLIQAILYEAARTELPLDSFLERHAQSGEILDPYLSDYRAWIEGNPKLRSIVTQLLHDNTSRLPDEVLVMLRETGLFYEENSYAVSFRNRLFQQYLSRILR